MQFRFAKPNPSGSPPTGGARRQMDLCGIAQSAEEMSGFLKSIDTNPCEKHRVSSGQGNPLMLFALRKRHCVPPESSGLRKRYF